MCFAKIGNCTRKFGDIIYVYIVRKEKNVVLGNCSGQKNLKM